jgi:hypothetical protein
MDRTFPEGKEGVEGDGCDSRKQEGIAQERRKLHSFSDPST